MYIFVFYSQDSYLCLGLANGIIGLRECEIDWTGPQKAGGQESLCSVLRVYFPGRLNNDEGVPAVKVLAAAPSNCSSLVYK